MLMTFDGFSLVLQGFLNPGLPGTPWCPLGVPGGPWDPGDPPKYVYIFFFIKSLFLIILTIVRSQNDQNILEQALSDSGPQENMK